MKKWRCTVCGYVYSGEEIPEKCPACSAEKSMLVEESDEKPAEKQNVKEEKVVDKGSSEPSSSQRKWKCTICNYIHTGEAPPDKCPVCGADKSFFIEVESQEKPEKKESEQVVAAEAVSTPAAPEKEKDQFGLVGRMIMRHHLHPISVHTPNGVLPVAIVFLLGGTFLGYASLELASFFNIIFVLLTMPAVIATGYIAWHIKYNGAKTFVFKTKLLCGLIVAVALTLMICWRLIDQTIAFAGGTGTYVYLGLGILALAAAGIAGHLGGKLVFNK